MSKFDKAITAIDKKLGSFAWAVASVGATVVILADLLGSKFYPETGFVILWLAMLAIYDKITKVERKINDAENGKEDK